MKAFLLKVYLAFQILTETLHLRAVLGKTHAFTCTHLLMLGASELYWKTKQMNLHNDLSYKPTNVFNNPLCELTQFDTSNLLYKLIRNTT